MTVFLKDKNGDWIQTISTKKLVLVISPGAGTYSNRHEYSRIAIQFELVYIGENAGKYDIYPDGWEHNSTVSHQGEHLGGLAEEVSKYISNTNKIPSVIICGSRGGQVTIGKIWSNVWRGPTIIINAGCLTSNTIIPQGVRPLFITMQNDYFKTVNTIIKITKEYYKLVESSNQLAYVVHLPNEFHLPRFENRLQNLLLNSILYILNKTRRISNEGIIQTVLTK
jgi:hypothetical protein